MLLDEAYGIHHLICEMPRCWTYVSGIRQSAGIATTPMLANFLPTDCDPSGLNAL